MNAVSAAERLLNHVGALLVVVSAVGYLVGYVSVWLFALGLGAVPQDLGLGQREYFLLGAVWAVILICYALAQLALTFGHLGEVREMLVVAYTGLVSLTLIPLWPTIGLLLLATVVVSGSVIGLYVSRLGISRLPLRRGRVYLGAGLLLLLFILSGYFSWWWGASLRHDPASLNGRGPIALMLAVPATEGQLTLGNREVCVIRFNERVFVSKVKVFIEAKPHTFRPEECF